MSLDFWNNPLVVSAFRVKYRRGGVFHYTALYILLLLGGGGLLYYYAPQLGITYWPQTYLIALFGVQYFLSPLMASVATSTSMKSEVVNRTLDFQRIAALSPRQILLGKLLGEPAHAFLFGIATIPLAVWCFALGVKGIGLVELFLLYVNLATATILFGSVGLLNRLEPTENKANTGGQAAGWAWGWIVAAVWVAIGSGFRGGAVPASAVPGGLVSPAMVVVGMVAGSPWDAYVLCYGLRIPFLVLAPLAQLLVAGLCFHSMVRRLVNPLNTALDKPTAYAVLLVVDLFAAAHLYTALAADFTTSAARFCVVHLLASLAMTTAVTPGRETLQSWVWRLRRQAPRLRALWIGERSENALALVTFSLIGAAVFVLGMLLPEAQRLGWPLVEQSADVLVPVAGLTLLLTFSLGTAFQWFQTFGVGRGAGAGFVSLIILVNAVPHLFGYYYQLPEVAALAPSAQYFQWISNGPINMPGTLPLWPILALYGSILVLAWLSLRRRLRRYEKAVDQKLEQMGVPAAARGA